MRKQVTIQLKALFLLLVFCMNTVLGFACSIGIDMGYNDGHHDEQKVAASGEIFDHCFSIVPDDQPEAGVPAPDDCCKNEVLKFNLSEKSVSSAIKLEAPAATALTIVALFFHPLGTADILLHHYYVRSDHPPISKDIRISIQSFQI